MFLTGMGSGGRVFLVAFGGWVVIQVQVGYFSVSFSTFSYFSVLFPTIIGRARYNEDREHFNIGIDLKIL